MDAGTAIGVTSLGLQVCQELLNYYDNWRQYNDDIAITFDTIKRLNALFSDLKTVLVHIDESKKKHALAALEACSDSLAKLQKKATKLQPIAKPTGSRQNIIAQLHRIGYPMRKGTLIRLQEIATDVQDQLKLSLDFVKLDMGVTFGTKLTEITEEISKVHLATDKISLQNEETLALLQSDLFEKAIRWLNAPDPETNYHSALARREPGTGAWLVDSTIYSQWKSGLFRHLWLYGKAGCGKSVILATIIEDIRNYCRDHADTKCAMFYFAFDEFSKQSFKDCLTSIVAQISYKEPALSMIIEAYQTMRGNSPKEDDLERILLATIDSQERFIVVLDGLDESPEYSTSGQALRQNLLSSLIRLSYGAPKIKILATSRHSIDIEDRMSQLGALPQSMLVEFVNKDIKRYVTSQLAADPRLCTLDQCTKAEIEVYIVEKADGMFRWVYCQMQDLKSLKSSRASYVTAAMKALPTTLDETHYQMLKRIQPQLFDDAMMLLRWITYSKRPMTLEELNETVLVNLETSEGVVKYHDRGNVRDVLAILSGLVVITADPVESIDQNTDNYSRSSITKDPISGIKIKLAHFSVKEYLESSRILETDAHKFHLWRSREESIIADSCLIYLMHYTKNELTTGTEKDLASFPLLQYTARYWPKHYQDDANLRKAVMFFQSDKAINYWTNVHQPDRDWRKPFEEEPKAIKPGTGLYYASHIGFYKVVKVLTESGMNVNTEGGFYGKALSAASAKGHEAVANLLIQQKADVNAFGGRHVATALQLAAFYEWVQIVEMLIKHGADVNAIGCEFYGTALHAAACSGNEHIINILISNGADIDAATELHSSALIAAAAYGHDQVVKKLVNLKARTRVDIGYYRTALMGAADQGQEHIIEMLVEQYGVDVNEQSGPYGTALIVASLTDRIWIVDILVQRYKANVDAQAGIYGTALVAAAVQGHEEIVKSLIEVHHAEVNLHACGIYKTALLAAAVSGHKMIIELLIEHNADLSIADDEGRTIIHCVARWGYLDLFNQLYNTGNVNLRFVDRHRKSVLDYACISGNLHLVDRVLCLIREDGYTRHSKSIWSPVHWACRSGSFELVALLQRAGEKAGPVSTIQPLASWTPLDIAIYHNNWDLLSMDGDLLHRYQQTTTRDKIMSFDQELPFSELSAFRANTFRPAIQTSNKYCHGCLSVSISLF